MNIIGLITEEINRLKSPADSAIHKKTSIGALWAEVYVGVCVNKCGKYVVSHLSAPSFV